MTAEHFESFKEIKHRLCTAPRLAHLNLEQPLVLYTDASKIAIGAVLLQRDNSEVERAISFVSIKSVAGAAKLFHVRLRMSRNYLFARACLGIYAGPQVLSAH